jgi:hypothetical protein
MNKDAVTNAIYNDEIEPVIDYCAGHPGALTRIHEAYQEAAGQPVDRSNIERYMDRRPDKRVHPPYGKGVLLLRVAKEVMRKTRATSQQKVKA